MTTLPRVDRHSVRLFFTPKVYNPRTFLILVVLLTGMTWLCACPPANAQSDAGSSPAPEFTPERFGFLPKTLDSEIGQIRFYLSTEGKQLNEERKLPLVLFLDGSGPNPLFWGNEKRLGSSLMFDASDFPGWHYAVISKPGVRFHETERRIKSKVYDESLTLRWRVDAADAVVNFLAKQKYIDTSQILVIGHSEGADVAPWVALENKHVTHVVGLAPGGVSQMLDFVLFARRKIRSGEMSVEEGAQYIEEIKEAYARIFADPKSTTKWWMGETYLRWSTFFQPGNEAWIRIQQPKYLGMCRDDKNTPVECGESIELELIRSGNQNYRSKVWPCDHYFMQVNDESDRPTDLRGEVVKDILKWVADTHDK